MLAPLILLGLAGILFTVAMKKPSSPSIPLPPSGGSGSVPKGSGKYTTETWMPYLVPLLTKLNIPLIFAMNWIRIESGGNPCAFGNASAKGPDGTPREQGITQLWNPDDFQSLKVPMGSFRLYCIPNTQVCSRPLTEDEMWAQARAHVAMIGKCTAYAARVLGDNGAGVLPGWDSRKTDFWRLAKLVHATPGMVKGMSYVKASLGRAPINWDEFKGTVLKGVKLDAGTERLRGEYARLFSNAERCASGVGAGVL